jgi:hypothetical protein
VTSTDTSTDTHADQAADRRPRPRTGPLAGIRVTDFCWMGVGAIATRILADFGAEVIRIEDRNRLDMPRRLPLYKGGSVRAYGEASGQNMVTIATEAICAFIAERSPVKPNYAFVEANHSGDKKASLQSFLSGRGRSVTCECIVPAALVEKRLHTTASMMANYWAMSAMGGVLSGTIGVQGHYANGLAALYLACGQDVACVAESAVGVTRFEP